MRILPLFMGALLVLGAGVPSARAEKETTEPENATAQKKRAKKLLSEGDSLFRKGDYEGALDRYQKAYEAFPSPKIYFPMAQAEEMLGRDLEALTHYEQLLAEAGEDLSEQVRKDAEARIAEIESRIAVITFAVEPEGAIVSIDDVEMGQAPLGEPVRLLPGPHKYSVRKEGYEPVEKQMDLKPGERVHEAVELERIRPRVAKRPPPRPRPEPQTGTGPSDRTILWGSIVTTGALAAGALVTGLVAVSKHGTYTDESLPVEEREKARESGADFAVLTDVLLVGTIAAGAFTAYWFYGKMDGEAAEPARADVAGRSAGRARAPRGVVVPWASRDGGGVAITGDF